MVGRIVCNGLGASEMFLWNIDVRTATTIITFSSNNHIVIWWSHGHSKSTPRIHMIISSYRTTSTFISSYRPMLIKRLCAIDWWLLNSSWKINVIGVAIGDNSSFECCATGRIVRSEILNDIVLNERISSPTVYSKITITIWLICSRVIDGSISTWIPSFSTN